MRSAVLKLVLLASLIAGPAAAKHHAPAPKPARPVLGPAPEGRLEVRIDSHEPLTWCDVLVSRDGQVVHHGKPGADGQLAVDRLSPGDYEVHAVARSWVRRGASEDQSARHLMWMRNGVGEGHGEIREAKKNKKNKPPKPEVVHVHMEWSPRVAGAVVAD
jgi:hypothetical protein